jgi:uncharacterized membrane protein
MKTSTILLALVNFACSIVFFNLQAYYVMGFFVLISILLIYSIIPKSKKMNQEEAIKAVLNEQAVVVKVTTQKEKDAIVSAVKKVITNFNDQKTKIYE